MRRMGELPAILSRPGELAELLLQLLESRLLTRGRRCRRITLQFQLHQPVMQRLALVVARVVEFGLHLQGQLAW